MSNTLHTLHPQRTQAVLSAKSRLLQGVSTLALAGTLLLSGCSGTAADSKIATVNGSPITRSDYDKAYDQVSKAFYATGAPQSQKERFASALRETTLKKLILQTLIHNEAAKMHLQATDADVDAYKKKNIYKDPAMTEKFKAFLDQNKISEDDFNVILKDNLLINKVIAAKAGSEIAVTDAEVKTAYDRNKPQFKLPERIHAAHILIEAIEPKMKKELREKNPKITDAELSKDIAQEKTTAKAKAEQDYQEVKAKPGRFEALAKLDSNDTVSAKEGGDLGFMVKSSTDPAFWAAIAKTPPGQLYQGVVASQFGFHVVKVLEHNPPHEQIFDEVKAPIREQLSEMKKQAFIQKWLEQERTTAKVKFTPSFEKSMKEQALAEQKQLQQENPAAAGTVPAGSPAPAGAMQAAPAAGGHS
jgi:parvulin-like peptidyl-prolyl isomerase